MEGDKNQEIYSLGEVEMQPLQNTGHLRRPLPIKKISFLYSRWTSLILFVCFCLGIFMIFLKLDNVQSVLKDTFSTESKDHTSILQARLALGKERFHSLLKEHYGEYADAAFDRETIMNSFHPPSERSRKRLKRRMKIKLLQAFLAPPNTTVDFIWATMGHSAAAGHGNLFNQTYSASIETAARLVFQQLGINFYAKNYAMGGTPSAPEMAMCLIEIIGKDVDILSWDFGMTDGGGAHYYTLFTQRAGVLKSRPIIFDFEGFEPHTEYNKYLDETSSMGVFTITLPGRNSFPRSDEENVTVDSFPSGIKDYVCTERFLPEVGACECCKWDTKACTDLGLGVHFQVSWHNGWKDHLFIGRTIAAFLVETLSDAIAELSDPPEDPADPLPTLTRDYLNYLSKQETIDRDAFFDSPLHPLLQGFDVPDAANFSSFLRSDSAACHTARLPADSRFRGLVLESHISSSYLYGGKTTYNSTSEAYPHGQEPQPVPDEESHPIVSYDYRAGCPLADIDAKDFFYVRESDGWKKMIVPNPSEAAYYESSKPRHGIVMICDKQFDWGNSPDDFVSISKLGNSTEAGDVSITINGIKVTESVTTTGLCFFMMHEKDFKFMNSTNNSYEIRLRVHKERVALMISAVVVF